ncbi:cysteine hydrolase family protein [Capnocytophaga sp.]|uniref:cysteine hydrolase family protein n=1 Tax=Capnocytophaga sp. TaxID=44737 RepID=UPI0026DB3888|nr:cysteine hydrolase family protein [Capnocytophaga sp.]MDO5105984.1 cysteine hydrolase family protein [Capnocytophaga sp.]
MNLRSKKPALLLIDVQKGFLDEAFWGGNRNNKNAEQICSELLKKWRELQLPVIHIRHSSKNPQSKLHHTNAGFDFNELVAPLPDEIVITKEVNSAFIGTNLKDTLDKQQIDTLVIGGITTNHCVSTTTRMAANYGYSVYLAADACACFDLTGVDGKHYDSQLIHEITLANLHNEFATVCQANQIFEML